MVGCRRCTAPHPRPFSHTGRRETRSQAKCINWRSLAGHSERSEGSRHQRGHRDPFPPLRVRMTCMGWPALQPLLWRRSANNDIYVISLAGYSSTRAPWVSIIPPCPRSHFTLPHSLFTIPSCSYLRYNTETQLDQPSINYSAIGAADAFTTRCVLCVAPYHPFTMFARCLCLW